MTSDPKGLGAVFDAHTDAEFKTRDIEATVATMGANPHVNHVPVMTGGCGSDGVRRFYETWFIGRWPEDVKVTLVSRTVGETQLVDELTYPSPTIARCRQFCPALNRLDTKRYAPPW